MIGALSKRADEVTAGQEIRWCGRWIKVADWKLRPPKRRSKRRVVLLIAEVNGRDCELAYYCDELVQIRPAPPSP